MKQITNYIFLDVDNVLIYQDQQTNDTVYNDTLIRALNAASLKEVILLTSMALRDIPERQKLVTHLRSQGITVLAVYSKLDLRLDEQILGRVWRLAQDSVTYNKNDGSLVVYDDRLKPLRAENSSADEKNIKLKGRTYDMTPKGKVAAKFLAEHANETLQCLFIDDSPTEIASVRDAFEPSDAEVETNNLLDKDRKAENPLLRTLVLRSAKGVLVTHFNSKELDENTFLDYARTFLKFKTLGLDEKTQLNFRGAFEKIATKGGKKLEEKVEALFAELDETQQSHSSPFSSSGDDDDNDDTLRTKSASSSTSTSRFSSIFKRGGRGGGAGGVGHQKSY